jgi:hypothetical protein
MRRKAELVALAAASVLVLAGCTSMFAPDPPAPTSTSTAARVFCTPITTRFAWTEDPAGAGYQSIRTDSWDFGTGTGSSRDAGPDESFSISPDDESPLADLVISDFDRWAAVLAHSARESGVAPVGFAADYEENETYFPPRGATSGAWVQVVVAPTASFRFRMTCRDGAVLGGLLAGPVTTTVRTFVLQCDGRSHPRDSPDRAVARAECPTT